MLHNIVNHFKTITKHKFLVTKGCFRAGLYKQGLLHDLSKYSPDEFFTGCRYYQGTSSPNAAEKKKIGYSTAWLHHKGRNKHHFEYWIDYGSNPDNGLIGNPMPTRYVVEMFIDRLCACKVYYGDNYSDRSALDYYLKNQSHYVMHDDTKKLLFHLLSYNAKHGEDKTFRYIRKAVLKNKFL